MESNKDRLQDIFDRQDALNKRFGWSQQEILALPAEEQLQRVRNFLEVLVIESGEALKAAKGRWWKAEKDWQGSEHLKEELVDVLHFLCSAYLAAGGSADQLYEQYCKKNSFNHSRPDWKINNESTEICPGGSDSAKADGGVVS